MGVALPSSLFVFMRNLDYFFCCLIGKKSEVEDFKYYVLTVCG